MNKENKEILRVFISIWLFIFWVLFMFMIGYEFFDVYPNLNEFRYVNVFLSALITTSILGSLVAGACVLNPENIKEIKQNLCKR